MGQSASTERREPQPSPRHEFRRLSRRLQDRWSVAPALPPPLDPPTTSPVQSQPLPSQGRPRSIATFSRQISAQSIHVGDPLGHAGEAPTPDQIFYQQQQGERPLVHMEELGMRNAPITHITASPMPRRLSTFSRLTTRIAPRSSVHGPPPADQERLTDDRSLRRRLSDRLASRPRAEGQGPGSRPFSMLGPLTRRPSLTPHPRRRRELAPISRPFPIVLDESTPSPHFMSAVGHRHVAENQSPLQQSPPSWLRHSSVRNSRFSRVRNSLSLPFESMRPLSRLMSSGNDGAHTPPERPSRTPQLDDPEYLLPPLTVTDTRLDVENSVLQSRLPEIGEQPTQRLSPTFQAPENPALGSDRWSDRGPGNGRDAQRVPNMLRGRSSRLIRRQDEGPLPRILHLAAVAIAAQLSGNPEQAITNLQAVGADGFDDSLNNLFRTLHEATDTMSTQAADGPSDSATSLGSLPPLNFLRVFRFINTNRDTDTQSNPSRPEGQTSPPVGGNPVMPNEDTGGATDGRTVTLVVVGVRSVPSDHIGHEDVATPGPSLETLLNMPLPPVVPPNVFRGSGSGGLLRRSDGRSRLPRPRRASIGGTNPFPPHQSRQRAQRFSSSPSVSGNSTPATASGSVSGQSDLPAGSHPPPSTPAESGLSPYSSGTTTPSRRPSSASALQQPPISTRDMAYAPMDDSHSFGADQQAPRSAHQRRRSESEFARHRNLGAGAARRNGVVAPDGVEEDNSNPPGSRSWLIYVVGTNISENHPALTTPSLFTDNPTYEDMLLLSSLLGPARPPVASREDVASAPGLYQLRQKAGTLVAAALHGGIDHIRLVPGERCLVCLCDYEVGEEIRRLAKCKHLFHRECIDQVRPRISLFLVEFKKYDSFTDLRL
ncbi:MAG: hypothetical protein L6R36_000013 [Xanthoria steineri]|nr:MAG: hypothetical protein L6R36_000013 [Xanthoria steineri]